MELIQRNRQDPLFSRQMLKSSAILNCRMLPTFQWYTTCGHQSRFQMSHSSTRERRTCAVEFQFIGFIQLVHLQVSVRQICLEISKLVVCSGSVMVNAYDFESGRSGLNPEWGPKYYEASITAQGLLKSSSLRGTRLVPEQLNIKAVTGHAGWLMVAVLRCVRPHFQWHQLAYATGTK